MSDLPTETDYWDEIDREALRLCHQLRQKLAELNAIFEKRALEIELSSPVKNGKTRTRKHHICILEPK